jgi:hypothetical protein
MTENARSSRKQAQQAEAATLLADGLSEVQVAERIGVWPRTITRWKDEPDFRVMVAIERDRIAAEIRRVHIANKQTRIDGMVARHRALLEVITERALAYIGQAPGTGTGLLARKITLVKVYEAGDLDKDGETVDNADGELFSAKKYREIPEFAIDRPLLAELREIEAAIAKELGQIINKNEVTGKDGGPLLITDPVAKLNDDDVDRRIAELESQLLGSPDAGTPRLPGSPGGIGEAQGGT